MKVHQVNRNHRQNGNGVTNMVQKKSGLSGLRDDMTDHAVGRSNFHQYSACEQVEIPREQLSRG